MKYNTHIGAIVCAWVNVWYEEDSSENSTYFLEVSSLHLEKYEEKVKVKYGMNGLLQGYV